MSLSCSCDTNDDAPWYYKQCGAGLDPLERKRGVRCKSCKTLTKPGAAVVEFRRFRYPKTEIEERIFGTDYDAVDLASWYLCETCGGLYLSLIELGFECINIDDDMRELCTEYAETYGRKQA